MGGVRLFSLDEAMVWSIRSEACLARLEAAFLRKALAATDLGAGSLGPGIRARIHRMARRSGEVDLICLTMKDRCLAGGRSGWKG